MELMKRAQLCHCHGHILRDEPIKKFQSRRVCQRVSETILLKEKLTAWAYAKLACCQKKDDWKQHNTQDKHNREAQ
jgi:hypothetical protein